MTAYALDPTGENQNNAVSLEAQQLLAAPTAFYNLIVVDNAPYFLDSLSVQAVLTAATNTTTHPLGQVLTLQRWVDYVPAFSFTQATEMSGKAVYAGIVLTDLNMAGSLTLAYQALGGDYQITTEQINQLKSSTSSSPVSDTYAETLALSVSFDAYTPDVMETTSSTLGQTGITTISQVETIATAADIIGQSITAKKTALDFSEHYLSTNNPHMDTADTYGLGLVPNWAKATQADVATATSTTLFLTPYSVANATKSTNNIPAASTSEAGLAKLNVGTYSGDDTDTTKSLTTQGLLALRNSATTNAIKSLTFSNRQQIFFNPLPLTYPCSFNGYTCFNFADLVNQVSNYLNIANIQGSQSLGCVWIPNGVSMGNVNLNVHPLFGFVEGDGAAFDLGLFSS